MSQVRLDTMVTVVDAGAFLAAYTTGDRMTQRPDLGVGGKQTQRVLRWLLSGVISITLASTKRDEIHHTGFVFHLLSKGKSQIPQEDNVFFFSVVGTRLTTLQRAVPLV